MTGTPNQISWAELTKLRFKSRRAIRPRLKRSSPPQPSQHPVPSRREAHRSPGQRSRRLLHQGVGRTQQSSDPSDKSRSPLPRKHQIMNNVLTRIFSPACPHCKSIEFRGVVGIREFHRRLLRQVVISLPLFSLRPPLLPLPRPSPPSRHVTPTKRCILISRGEFAMAVCRNCLLFLAATLATAPTAAIHLRHTRHHRTSFLFDKQFPAFEAKDIRGRTWKSSDLNGRFTLIYIWNTLQARSTDGIRHTHLRQNVSPDPNLPELQRFYDKVKNSGKIQILTFTTDYDYMHSHDYMKVEELLLPCHRGLDPDRQVIPKGRLRKAM